MNESKQYDIPKRAVIEAYKRVKANKGSAGIDGIDLDIFEEKLNNNLYKIWNRMSSGSYFPSPVMAVEIPKRTGGIRRLGIPTITDRVAQMVARMYVEHAVESMFCDGSYGYRPNKSALDAIEMTRKRCWSYDYVIELDVKGLFDNIDHVLLMRVVRRHVKEAWICTAPKGKFNYYGLTLGIFKINYLIHIFLLFRRFSGNLSTPYRSVFPLSLKFVHIFLNFLFPSSTSFAILNSVD